MKNKNLTKIMAVSTITILLITLLCFTQPAPFCNAQGGYEQPSGGGGGGLPSGYTVLSNVITPIGKIIVKTTASSFDGLCTLTIDKDTIALRESGYPIFSILMVASKLPPPPPANSNIVGLVYDFQPNGATFDPAITATFRYNPDNLPEGYNEADLTIAFYDTAID